MAGRNERWRQALHLEPPHGWLNDPNGLCFFGGWYHVYFQYAPDRADGNGRKCWGHYRSRDLLRWEFTGTVLFPDTPDDRDGVYSGCAVADGDTLHLFYTGNVKEAGEHDYIRSGRGANVIHVTTRDGEHMSAKETLLRNADYPAFCSCHVRDPKVWREDGRWHMVLGARTLDDTGCVLFYTSDDLRRWQYDGQASVPDFGYMWECPDVFSVGGHRWLSVSPQGLPHGADRYPNVYQSGRFRFDGRLESFAEWDRGFDFYAPQSFEAPDGRRILIGWMGIGDAPYQNPTTALGYQHCLTLPREVTMAADGTLCQNPVRELAALRGGARVLRAAERVECPLPFEVTAAVERPFSLTIADVLTLCWDGQTVTLRFADVRVGGGRGVRRAALSTCRDVRLVADTSAVEVYLDGGRVVMSSRMYPDGTRTAVTARGLRATLYTLNRMEVTDCGE